MADPRKHANRNRTAPNSDRERVTAVHPRAVCQCKNPRLYVVYRSHRDPTILGQGTSGAHAWRIAFGNLND